MNEDLSHDFFYICDNLAQKNNIIAHLSISGSGKIPT